MSRLRVILFLGLGGLLLVSPLLAAAGGGFGGGPCAGFARGEALVMRDSCFDGVAHFVPAGTRLVVRNDGQAPHSLTAIDGSFDTGLLQTGETAEIVLEEPGIVPVYCTLHGNVHGEGMAGVLIVGEPTPEMAIGPGTSDLAAALKGHESLVRREHREQTEALADLRQEIGALRDQSTRFQARATLTFGALGLLAVGAVLAGASWQALRGRRGEG